MRPWSLFLLLMPLTAVAQGGVTGLWKTIDDNTGRPRSVVEITDQGGRLHGRIVKLFRDAGEDPDPVCDECPGDRKDRKVIGLEIIRDLVRDGSEWEDGTILDPENGKVYDCKIWLENGTLKVRGYVAFFFRTQTWLRYDGS